MRRRRTTARETRSHDAFRVYQASFRGNITLSEPACFDKSSVLSAFPDLHVTIHDQVAEGNKVVSRKTFHGTHQGELMGSPATGKQVAFDVIDILQLADGKITDHWVVVDQLGLMQQIGVIPAPGQAS
jgi:predicted ester cyclase